jgi:hypothetical protein
LLGFKSWVHYAPAAGGLGQSRSAMAERRFRLGKGAPRRDQVGLDPCLIEEDQADGGNAMLMSFPVSAPRAMSARSCSAGSAVF